MFLYLNLVMDLLPFRKHNNIGMWLFYFGLGKIGVLIIANKNIVKG
jgi:hypothetical protein